MESKVYQEFNELEGHHWWFKGRRKYLRRLIAHFVSNLDDAAMLCEIGSGTGGNLAMLAEIGQVDAVEMNDAARAWIKQKNIPGVRSVSNGHLPEAIDLDGQYDAVFSLDVIEHVVDDHGALVRLKELLQPGGLLVTTVPAYQWLWSAHDEANHHQRRYTMSAYCALLRRAGFDIKYASYFNTLLFPLAAISRLAQGLFRNADSSKQAMLSVPSPLVNTLLLKIFSIESYIAGKLRLPFGLSIAVVAVPSQLADR